MKSFRFGVCGMAMFAVLSMFSLNARADDKAPDDQYQALAAQRLKAEMACKKLLLLVDASRSGWTESIQALDALRGRIQSTYQNAIRAEQTKADGDRNQPLIGELNAQLQQLDTDWQALLRDRNAISNTYAQVSADANRVRGAFDSLVGVERSWKEAGLDLNGLSVSYDIVTKTMDGYSANAEKAINDLKAKQKDWEAKLTAAAKTVEPPK